MMDGNRRACEFEKAFNSMLEKNKQNASSPPESAASEAKDKSLRSLAGFYKRSGKTNLNDDKREMEKAQNLINLICWGPNWS